MIKYVNHDIVFQEIPDEVTLAVNLSLCPNACPGCHSGYLQQNVGEELTESRLFSLIEQYVGEITCVSLMGGDNDPARVTELLAAVRQKYGRAIRTAWYSGCQHLPDNFQSSVYDYVKVGPYIAQMGPLSSPTTNQRIYRVEHPAENFVNITYRMQKPKR